MNQFVLPLIFVLAFLAVALIAQSIGGSVMAARAKTQRVNRRLTLLAQGKGHREVYETLVRQREAPNISNRSILNIYNDVERVLSQAGLNATPLMVLGIWLGSACGLWLLTTFVLRTIGTALPTAQMVMSLVGALILTGLAVVMVLNFLRNRRLRVLEEQLPLALDIVIRSLRAGHPVVSALQLVTSEMGDPVGSEFGLIVDETTYGFELKEALANFARRTGSEDAHFFAVSVAIQTETGGNLAEILDNLARVVRGRITLGKRVKALSSEGRMSALVLSGLPLFLVGSLALGQPKYYTERWGDPMFWPIVGGVVMLYALGLYMMHRIANFKY